MKVLVTGGLGFIGSFLSEQLRDLGHEVTIVDNMSSNVVQTIPGCQIIRKKITNDLPYLSSFDVVFHLASVVGPVGVLNKADIGSSAVENLKAVIKFCLVKGATLIYMSSSEVYGHSGNLSENTFKLCNGPYEFRTEYGVSKLLSEIIISNRARLSGLAYQIIRPFNISGPRQLPDNGFVLPRFVIAMLTSQPLTVYGNGNQRRAFADVRDIVDATVKIAFDAPANNVWNIGNPGNEMRINDLANLVMERSENEPKRIYIDPREIHGDAFAESFNKVPQIDKIQKALGWSPNISLYQTMSDTIDYWRARIDSGYGFNVTSGSYDE